MNHGNTYDPVSISIISEISTIHERLKRLAERLLGTHEGGNIDQIYESAFHTSTLLRESRENVKRLRALLDDAASSNEDMDAASKASEIIENEVSKLINSDLERAKSVIGFGLNAGRICFELIENGRVSESLKHLSGMAKWYGMAAVLVGQRTQATVNDLLDIQEYRKPQRDRDWNLVIFKSISELKNVGADINQATIWGYLMNNLSNEYKITHNNGALKMEGCADLTKASLRKRLSFMEKKQGDNGK